MSAQGTAPNGADTLIDTGKTGTDTADYGGRPGTVAVTKDGVANDGESGESDNVGLDVEQVTGVP